MTTAEHLRKTFKAKSGDVIAVDDVGFTARDGEITGLLGPNGAGKTTTLRMLYTLGIRIDATRLARNYGLAHDQSKVHQYPSSSPKDELAQGELEVLRGCDGETLAKVALPAGTTLGEQFTLDAPLPPRDGVHDLCLRFTASIEGPLYAIGAVRLIEAIAQSPPARR